MSRESKYRDSYKMSKFRESSNWADKKALQTSPEKLSFETEGANRTSLWNGRLNFLRVLPDQTFANS